MEQNYNRSLMNNTRIARLSMSSGQGREGEYQISFIGRQLGGADRGIRYDRTGWDGRTRGLKPLAIVLARDAEFVELDWERVIRTGANGGFGFEGPQKRRWRKVVQALFVASVLQQFWAADTVPWKVHSIRWCNNLP